VPRPEVGPATHKRWGTSGGYYIHKQATLIGGGLRELGRGSRAPAFILPLAALLDPSSARPFPSVAFQHATPFGLRLSAFQLVSNYLKEEITVSSFILPLAALVPALWRGLCFAPSRCPKLPNICRQGA
jgi:hypothetical protein